MCADEAFGVCVQMSQICVRRCVYVCVQMSPQKHVVCTDESDLCAQMRLLGCVYR